MIDYTYPHQETDVNPLGAIPPTVQQQPSNIEYEPAEEQIQNKIPPPPTPIPLPPAPLTPAPKTPTTEEDYINSLTPASYTTYNPDTAEKADDIYNQSYNNYVDGMSDESILSKSKKLMDFYGANKPDPEKSMSDFDDRVKATLISRALGDLTSSIGSAVGNKGGMANIKEKNFSAFDNAYNAHMNAVKEKGVRDYNQKVQDFQTMLSRMEQENQMLNSRDAAALAYAGKARDNFTANNKVTYNNSSELQKDRIEADVKKRESDHKNAIEVARIRSKGGKSVGSSSGGSSSENKKGEKAKALTKSENIFKNGISALKSGKIVHSSRIMNVDKDGKHTSYTGKKQQKKFTEGEITAIEDIWYKSSNKKDAIMKLESKYPVIFNFGKQRTEAHDLFESGLAE